MDLSIIIPTFNRLWSLPSTIQSCQNTLCKSEIIVIDDGSTDGTWDWLQQQKGVVAIKQDNWGKCWAVNKGFEIARGKYIRFLDSDDLIADKANDEQVEIAEKFNSDIVVSGYKLFTDDGSIIKTQAWVDCDDFIAQQLGECDSSHYSSYLFKKEFIKDILHRPDFELRDDRLFVLEAALKDPKTAIHSGCALLHRVHLKNRLQLNSGSKQIVQNYQHLRIYKRILKSLETSGTLTPRRAQAAINALWPLAHWIAKYNIQEATELVTWIYELNPKFTSPDKGLLRTLHSLFGFSKTQHILKIKRLLQ